MNGNSTDDLDNPKPFLMGDSDSEEAIVELGEQLKSGKRRIFFYAGSGFDWQPLHRFSHRCDCFVYVDPRAKQPEDGGPEVEWEKEHRRLVRGETTCGANLKGAQFLHSKKAYDVLTKI